MLLRLMTSLLPFLVLTDGEDASNDSNASDSSSDRTDDANRDDSGTDDDALKEPGKAALKAEREARKQAEKAKADLEKRITAFEAQQREADEAKAKEKGEWEKIATDRQTEIDDLKRQIAERDRDELRARIARKHNLPEDAAKYLTGDDEEAIESAAKDLAKLTARREDVDTDSGKPNAGGGGGKKSESLLATYKFGTRR